MTNFVVNNKRVNLIFTDWSLLLKWIFATAIGWAIGYPIISHLYLGTQVRASFDIEFNVPIINTVITSIIIGMIAGYLVGIVIGVTQWLVLRHKIHKSLIWILNSVLGWAIAWGIIFGVYAVLWNTNKVVTVIIVLGIPICGAAIVGISQWYILRQQILKSEWWILVNAVSWPMGVTLGRIVGGTSFNAIDKVITGVVAGIIIGGITGVILIWLLQQKADLDTHSKCTLSR